MSVIGSERNGEGAPQQPRAFLHARLDGGQRKRDPKTFADARLQTLRHVCLERLIRHHRFCPADLQEDQLRTHRHLADRAGILRHK